MEDLKTRPGVFEDVVLVGGGSVNLTGSKEPERLEFVNVTPNYFTMLGARPQIGRLFGPQDFALGFAEAAVISDGLWRRAFGKDPNILGRIVRLDNDLYTIVGVLPPEFRHPGKTIGCRKRRYGSHQGSALLQGLRRRVPQRWRPYLPD